MKLISIVALCVFVVSCASLDKSDCQTVSWYELGKADGAKGYDSQANKYSKDCGKHGIAVNLPEYENGRKAGLVQYCTYESGVSSGRRGLGYGNVCTGKAHEEFYSGYEPNVKVAMAQRAIGAKKAQISRAEKNLTELKDPKLVKFQKLNLDAFKVELVSLQNDLSKRERELVLHNFDREILILNREIAAPGISEEAKLSKLARIAEIQERRDLFEKADKFDSKIDRYNRLKGLFK